MVVRVYLISQVNLEINWIVLISNGYTFSHKILVRTTVL